jgi:hypothetical protein
MRFWKWYWKSTAHIPDRERLLGTSPQRRFLGHTAGVTVNVYNDGWSSGNLSDHALRSYIDVHINGAELADLKNEIENIMEELRYAGKM